MKLLKGKNSLCTSLKEDLEKLLGIFYKLTNIFFSFSIFLL